MIHAKRKTRLPLYILGLNVCLLALGAWIVHRGGAVETATGGAMAVGALASMAGAILEIRSIHRVWQRIGRLWSLLAMGVAVLGMAGWIINDGGTVHVVAGGMAAAGALAIMMGAIFEFRHNLRRSH